MMPNMCLENSCLSINFSDDYSRADKVVGAMHTPARDGRALPGSMYMYVRALLL